MSHDFRPGTWASLDGNFWWGGTGSRIGGTGAWRFTKHQSLKASYSAGTYSRFGGNYQNVSVALAVFVARLAQEEVVQTKTLGTKRHICAHGCDTRPEPVMRPRLA